MYENIRQRVATLVSVVASISITAQPAAASHRTPDCSSSQALQPLHSLSELVFLSRTKFTTLGFTTVFLALIPRRAAAQSSASCADMPSQFQAIAELLTRVQQLGIALALLIATIMLIYGGILWMRGTPDSQQKARGIIFNTFVGLVIVLMAGGLVEFVKGVLCGGA